MVKILLVKNILKILIRFFLYIYSLLISPASLLLLIIFKKKSSKNFKGRLKYLSLRITKKYFGHQAIEPAIASSIIKNNNHIRFRFSFKEKGNYGNKKLTKIIKETFYISNDLYLLIAEHIYNHSFEFISKKIKKYYSPLLPKRNLHREMQYWPVLQTENNFLWKEKALEIINKKSFVKENSIIIALRSEHFHKDSRNVSPQLYRNVNIEDWFHLLEACNEINFKKNIYCYCNKDYAYEIKNKFKDNPYILTINQEDNDILDLLNPSNLLINNGNGIGATTFAIGIRTLFIKHSPWHVWYTPFSNSLMIPIDYKKSNNKIKDLNNNLKLAFSAIEEVPFNFEKNFLSKNIRLQSIKDIDKKILKESIKEAIILDDFKRSKQTLIHKGCEFDYRFNLEKIFWMKYIDQMPESIRYWHKKITMKISRSYLESFY